MAAIYVMATVINMAMIIEVYGVKFYKMSPLPEHDTGLGIGFSASALNAIRSYAFLAKYCVAKALRRDCGGGVECSQGGSQSTHSDPFQRKIQVKVLRGHMPQKRPPAANQSFVVRIILHEAERHTIFDCIHGGGNTVFPSPQRISKPILSRFVVLGFLVGILSQVKREVKQQRGCKDPV